MSSSTNTIALSGSYELSRLAELRTELLEFSGQNPEGPVHLDLEAVDRADVGLVQLLASFGASLSAKGRELTLALSGAVETLFQRAGVPVPGR
ncbi:MULTISPECIES: STAS domain-containing protein [unclassified Aureimonas]|uniref:STAS domain-containing protein n=1 Tax=unclassified Aureimonas TaxID=2615206 RepID=UPI000721B649|nr:MULTISPECIES: STAS domain-containing protein [unclassified Aureimonas]ALN71194.1 hypothetical protein M673_00625 [Aureimonas sp. AU20]